MLSHHCRILPRPGSLQLALAAGLTPERVACLHPEGDGRLERALCRRWGIRSVLCRQSGGESEERWHEVCGSLGLKLLLLARPAEPDEMWCLTPDELVAQVGSAPRPGAAQPAH